MGNTSSTDNSLSNKLNNIIRDKINENKNNQEWLINYFIIEWYKIHNNYKLLNNTELLDLVVDYLDGFLHPSFKITYLAVQRTYLSASGYGGGRLCHDAVLLSIVQMNLLLKVETIKNMTDLKKIHPFELQLIDIMYDASQQYLKE